MDLSDSFHQPPTSGSAIRTYGDEPAISYDHNIHRTRSEFERSTDYLKFIRQLELSINEVKVFLIKNSKDNTKIDQLDLFLTRIKEGSKGYFSTVIDLVYRQGKKALDEIIVLLRDDDIPLHKRISEAQRLPVDLAVCGPGAVTNFLSIASNLNLSKPNLHAYARGTWLSLVEQALLKFAQERHEHEESYEGNEIHYVNGYGNAVAELFHRPAVEDPFIPPLKREDLEECAAYLLEQITAETLIEKMSEDCLEELRNHFYENKDRQIIVTGLQEVHENYADGFSGEIAGRYGEIPFPTVFSSNYMGVIGRAEETGKETYSLVNQTAIIADDIINNMQEHGFLTNVNAKELAINPLSTDRREVVRGTEDSFFVVAKDGEEPRPIAPDDLAWIRKNSQNLHPGDLARLSRAALHKLHDTSLSARLGPDDVWSMVTEATSDSVERLKMLSERPVRHYMSIRANARQELEGRFLNELPVSDLSAVLNETLKSSEQQEYLLGRLLRLWRRTAPVAMRNFVNKRDLGGRNALFWSLRNGHVQAVTAFASAEMQGGTTLDALQAKDRGGTPGLVWAMLGGHAEAVRAYAKTVLPQNPETHAALFNVKNSKGIPALALALSNGHGEAVKAYAEAIHTLDRRTKLSLLAAVDQRGTPGLIYALNSGRAEAVTAYAEAIRTLDDEARAYLLKASGPDGISGLQLALENGHAEAVRAYADAIKWLGPARQAEFLKASDPEGTSGLHFALEDGHAEAVRAYSNAIQSLSRAKQAEFLKATRPDGISGLYLALQNGHAETVRAYGGALQSLSPAMQVEFLKATRPDGTSALFFALKNGHTKAIRAYGDIVQSRSSLRQTELLQATSRDGTSGLYFALKNGRAGAVKAYCDTIQRLDPATQARLLRVTARNGESGLSLALENGHADAVRAYGEAVQRLDPAARIRLLRVQASDLSFALKNGHAEAIRAYGDIIRSLSPARQAEFLQASAADGTSGLFFALKNGHTGAVKAYCETVQRLDPAVQARLLRVKAGNGESGLSFALENGHADAIRAYTNATRTLDPRTRAELLEEATSGGTSGLAAALRDNHVEAIRAYAEAILPLDREIKATLFRASTAEGVPGVALALMNGNVEAIRAYAEAIRPLDRETQIRLLDVTLPGGGSGLTEAIASGQEGAAGAYAEAMQPLDGGARARLSGMQVPEESDDEFGPDLFSEAEFAEAERAALQKLRAEKQRSAGNSSTSTDAEAPQKMNRPKALVRIKDGVYVDIRTYRDMLNKPDRDPSLPTDPRKLSVLVPTRAGNRYVQPDTLKQIESETYGQTMREIGLPPTLADAKHVCAPKMLVNTGRGMFINGARLSPAALSWVPDNRKYIQGRSKNGRMTGDFITGDFIARSPLPTRTTEEIALGLHFAEKDRVRRDPINRAATIWKTKERTWYVKPNSDLNRFKEFLPETYWAERAEAGQNGYNKTDAISLKRSGNFDEDRADIKRPRVEPSSAARMSTPPVPIEERVVHVGEERRDREQSRPRSRSR